MTEQTVEFLRLVETLRTLGHEIRDAELLENPKAAWSAIPVEIRRKALDTLGLKGVDPNAVELKLGKRHNAPKTIENVLVVISAPDAPPAPPPKKEAKAEAPAQEKKGLFGKKKAEPKADAPAAAEAAPAAPAKEKKGLFGKKKAEAPPEAPPPIPGSAPGAESLPAQPEKKGLFARKKEIPVGPAEAGDEGPITPIPPIDDPNVSTVEVYAVQEPYAFIRVLYDKSKHESLYEVLEPVLSAREKNVLEFVEDTLVDVIEVGLGAVTQEDAANLLKKHVDDIIYDYSVVLSPRAKEKLLYYILRDFLGYGKLDPIMRDDLIEDISCDGPKVPIFLYHRKHESVKSTVMFMDHREADSYVIRMAQRSGKHISIAEPLLDATLPNGSRLNATLSTEVTAGGSTFTIRKFRDDPFTPPDLVRFGTMNADILAYWWLAVQNGASAIYAGGTASGKTTSLNAILLFIPPQMKIVSIEDTREINLPHPNWIAGVTRSGFGPRDNQGRQAGEIDMFTLLKAALRQRPEYILVGEVRGAEAYALFQAMATGHTAYGTMHADSVDSVIHRLESAPISIPRSLLEALDIVSIQIQTRIGGRRVRRTKELVEVVGLDPHTREILTNQVFTWSPATDKFEYSGVSYVFERIQLERNMTDAEMKLEVARRKEIIEWMILAEMHDYKTVGAIIASYYKDPESTLERCKAETARIRAEKGEPPKKDDQPATAPMKEVAVKAPPGKTQADAEEQFKRMRAELAKAEEQP